MITRTTRIRFGLILAAAVSVAAAAAAAAGRAPAQGPGNSPAAPAGAAAQSNQSNQGNQGSHDMSAMPGMGAGSGAGEDAASAGAADSAMSHEHMGMGAHMKMTAPRARTAADERRADAIAATLRGAIAKYRDYRVAVADHFIEFLPNLKQPMYHFTNYRNAYVAHSEFDPGRPTSLLYKPTPGGGFELIGAMYTAPRDFDENQLDERVPLSVAAWHQHVNICMPPKTELLTADWKKFGTRGTISTAGECQASGGTFHPVIFGWMVHVYPFEQDPAKIWAH